MASGLADVPIVVAGLALLPWGADRLVKASASLARSAGVPTLVVGLTIVALGTSAPELLVSTMAALQNKPGLSVGNAVGSDITNLGLVVGITAVLTPLRVRSGILRREFPALLAAAGLTWALLWNGTVSRLDGLLLLACMAGLVAWLVALARRPPGGSDPAADEYARSIPPAMPVRPAVLRVVAGLAALLVGSRLLVWGATGLARSWGVSDLVIGLSIVALGTSLPELAASAAGALHGEHDIAVGNVIGSNLVNLLVVIGGPAVLHPLAVAPAVRLRDLPVMLAFTLALYAMCFGRGGRAGRVTRAEGALLVAAFAAYQGWLWIR
ncbi:MAG TPA: calcium/sodium antiporter [Gammaproteobacteria bacterium]|nr:calcium/sodium antiporter [Gammaproteobacteria bacterium]